MRKQRGITLTGTIVTLTVLGVVGVTAARLAPAYMEAQKVQKILNQMVAAGATKGTVREIRYSYEKYNAIEDVKTVRGEDLEITKQGQDAVVSAAWSVRIPIAGNMSACLDFTATTAQ